MGPWLKVSSDRSQESHLGPLGTRRVVYPLHHGGYMDDYTVISNACKLIEKSIFVIEQTIN